jgi:hypothetical protein
MRIRVLCAWLDLSFIFICIVLYCST